MSARDEIIDKLADNIDFDAARLLGIRAGVAARFFGGEKDAQARFALILEHLERMHATSAFAQLFDVVRKDHPRTVAECEAILRASPDHGAVIRSSHAERPVRVIANGRPVSMLVGRGTHDFTVQIGARTRDEPPPELEIVGEQPSDKIDRSAATLERTERPEWWEIGVSFTRIGMRSRKLSLRVVDETAPTESVSLRLVDRTAQLVARIYCGFCAILCLLLYAVAFGSYAGSHAPLLALAIPIGGIAAGIATLRPRFARFGTPPYLFGLGSLLFMFAAVPGEYLVAVENQTDAEVTIGEPIAKGSWVTMSASSAEAAESAYCMTAAARGSGLLSTFLPWRTVKNVSPRWTVVENTFAPEVIAHKLDVHGGALHDRTVLVQVLPPDCAGSTARASLKDYLAATIQIPYGWTLSSFTEQGTELLKLVHVFGAPRLDFATKLVVTDRGDLACESGSPIILEPLPEIPDTKNLELTSEGEDGTASHWRSTSPRAWRCRIQKTKVNNIVLSTTADDFDLPAELGAARLTIGGQKIEVPADARKIKRRTVTDDVTLPRGSIDLDSGGKAVIDANHIVMALKTDGEKETFRKNDEDFTFEVKEKTKPVRIDKLPPGSIPRLVPDRIKPVDSNRLIKPAGTKPTDAVIKPAGTKPTDAVIKPAGTKPTGMVIKPGAMETLKPATKPRKIRVQPTPVHP